MVTQDDIELHVRLQAGDITQEDCSCDSDFMLKIMPRVATAMREKFSWVPNETPLYLVMDNAGGHGTKDCITEYTAIMQAQNIKIIWQVPRSPETNMLDLGI